MRFVIVYINEYNDTEIKVFWFVNYAKYQQMIWALKLDSEAISNSECD